MTSAHIILRKLTGSELGWFAEPRQKGKAKGRQRGINFNAAEMERIFPGQLLAKESIPIVSCRHSDGQVQRRQIRRQEKNWRLVGPKVSGSGLEGLEEGDFFWAEIDSSKKPPIPITWDVITAAGNQGLHERISREFSVFLSGGMTSWPVSDRVADYLASIVGLRPKAATPEAIEVEKGRSAEAGSPPSLPTKPLPPAPAPRKRKRIDERLRRPHILAEIVKNGLALSARAQADYIDILDTLSDEIRELFLKAKLITKSEINHRKTWAGFKGSRIGFVDGGMANVAAVGAAPVAIRVGSYVVVPGDTSPAREAFNFEIQLVDDLYESSKSGSGVYDDLFEDVAKLRDAARIACEVGGLLSLSIRQPSPGIMFLHGPLVNPVSPYALEGFPNFTEETVKKLLPGDARKRAERDANFVSVYLSQLNALKSGKAAVCGVIERPSPTAPGRLVRRHLENMHSENLIDSTAYHEFIEKMGNYRVTDSVIFECVLEEGEYLEPQEIDKQEPHHKIPSEWELEIKSYPKPLTTYVKANAETMPMRVESFPTKVPTYAQLMKLVVHMSRLLPRYSFPVGLDIVDKHAKVPEWMSKQIDVMLSAQLMHKAMQSGNPAAIRLVRRILSANTRDWLFRPDFRRG